MKNILKFIIILLPWFFSSLFLNNTNYYLELKKPIFALNPISFSIIWLTLYIFITISIYIIYSKYDFKETKSYNKTLLINYLFNQMYIILFFNIQSLFLSFVDCIIIFVTSLFLYYETKFLDKKAANWLLPYIIFSIFASILSLTIFLMNF